MQVLGLQPHVHPQHAPSRAPLSHLVLVIPTTPNPRPRRQPQTRLPLLRSTRTGSLALSLFVVLVNASIGRTRPAPHGSHHQGSPHLPAHVSPRPQRKSSALTTPQLARASARASYHTLANPRSARLHPGELATTHLPLSRARLPIARQAARPAIPQRTAQPGQHGPQDAPIRHQPLSPTSTPSLL
jgi:hypothetical protein